jgi:hypothetical protein
MGASAMKAKKEVWDFLRRLKFRQPEDAQFIGSYGLVWCLREVVSTARKFDEGGKNEKNDFDIIYEFASGFSRISDRALIR